jgi:hypothetical protein
MWKVSFSNETVRNTIAAAGLALFSWHTLTLHEIAKSVEVLLKTSSTTEVRLERLENAVFFNNANRKE